MAVDLHPSASHDSFAAEPYSYAAERALSERELTVDELEASIKETPPRPSGTFIRSQLSNSSEPRSLGDVMDESEKMLPPGSPSLRHTKGRLEHGGQRLSSSGSYTPKDEDAPLHERGVNGHADGESYADVVKHEQHNESARVHKHDSAYDQHGSVKKEPGPDHKGPADGMKQDSTSQKHNPNHTDLRPDEIKQESAQDKENHASPFKQENKEEHATEHKPAAETEVSREPAQKAGQIGNSYADAVKHEPTSPFLRPLTPPDSQIDGANGGTDKPSYPSPPNSVTQKSEQPQHQVDTLNTQEENAATKHEEPHPQNEAAKTQNANGTAEVSEQPGKLIYENYQSRSGTNLASIALGKTYDLSLTQAEVENKDAPAEDKEEKPVPTLVSGRRAGAGWSRSAVRWAPHNVPLQRRLQTLAVLAHSLSIASFVALFFSLCAIPIFWPILIPYLIYILLSNAASNGKLSHRSEYLRRSKFWSAFASYFPARLHRTVELEPTRKYIFGYHPHGIISHGAFAAFVTEALGFSSLFPGITNTLLTLDSNFRLPFYRDWALRLGLASVSKESCENLLSKGGLNGRGMGRAITIVIGGAREALDAKPGTLNLVLARRKGFIKLAVRTGADLVPVLAFGENDMYEQIGADTHPWIHKGQLLLKKFMGFTVPLFHARGIFNYDVGIMPYRRPINIVVGRPIRTVRAKNPDPTYIDELHKQYTDELLHIWEDWKDSFAPDRKGELQIVE